MRDPDPAWRACQPVGGKSTWVNHLGGRSRITVRDCELRLLQSRSVIHDKLHGNHSKIPLPDTALPPSYLAHPLHLQQVHQGRVLMPQAAAAPRHPDHIVGIQQRGPTGVALQQL